MFHDVLFHFYKVIKQFCYFRLDSIKFGKKNHGIIFFFNFEARNLFSRMEGSRFFSSHQPKNTIEVFDFSKLPLVDCIFARFLHFQHDSMRTVHVKVSEKFSIVLNINNFDASVEYSFFLNWLIFN